MENKTISKNELLKDEQNSLLELTVSELAFSLKKTLENNYGRVLVRGELSRVSMPRSGHIYADLKDESSVLNTVCWKGSTSRLSVRPEEGLEVIVMGRITTYPARSNYQLIIESMSLAGEGAILKMLEKRRKELAAEGLFSADRKKPCPFLPQTIGVITSPTGAVFRDIMHRLEDRFPRHVLLWPVLVQGDAAAHQIVQAIDGFNSIDSNNKFPKKPDLLIVARGGGSLEDLMAFNEETVVRAVARSSIPIISAIGHETDTTLIDLVADLRAPTPTGAAEMAVPVRKDVLLKIQTHEARMTSFTKRLIYNLRNLVLAASGKLEDPARLLEIKFQKLDHLVHKLDSTFERTLLLNTSRLERAIAQLRHPKNLILDKQTNLTYLTKSLFRLGPHITIAPQKLLVHSTRMLESLSFKRVLDRGFVVVRDHNGKPIEDAGLTSLGQMVKLEFKHNQYVEATIGKNNKDS